MKKVMGVLLAGALLFTSGVYASTKMEWIEVARNSIDLKVDGLFVDAENFIFEGRTYVPLRKVSEMFGKDVFWDNETRTVSIADKVQDVKIVNKDHKMLKDGSLQLQVEWSDGFRLIASTKAIDHYGMESIVIGLTHINQVIKKPTIIGYSSTMNKDYYPISLSSFDEVDFFKRYEKEHASGQVVGSILFRSYKLDQVIFDDGVHRTIIDVFEN